MVKYFPLDKNYILKKAQLSSKAALKKTLFQEIKSAYFHFFNPLKLEDTHTCQIIDCQRPRWKKLDDFYNYLAAIYRYKFGENQLEFQFDGKTHHQKYCEEWGSIFEEWIKELCQDSFFVRAVLELLVFLEKGRRADLTEMRLKSIVASHFQLRIHKSRGILENEAA